MQVNKEGEWRIRSQLTLLLLPTRMTRLKPGIKLHWSSNYCYNTMITFLQDHSKCFGGNTVRLFIARSRRGMETNTEPTWMEVFTLWVARGGSRAGGEPRGEEGDDELGLRIRSPVACVLLAASATSRCDPTSSSPNTDALRT